MIIPLMAREDPSQYEYQEMTPRFLSRFTCFPTSYILVVAIHSLGGLHSYRHHMPNPHSGAIKPTQDEDPHATSNSIEYLLILYWGKVKNPSQSTD